MSGQPPPRPEKTRAFDLLASVAAFAREHAIALNDPSLVERFIADAGPKLVEALADPTLIHGSRTERLLEATVLSLGRFRLLKTEDAGRVHAAGTFRAPDFRVVLDEGEQWLVEVKNVRIKEPFKQETRMSAACLASLQAYADIVGTPLKLAIFRSLWNIWTVISPDRFRTQNDGLRVTMKYAVLANESERLGEVIIMTKPPLRLVLEAATDMPRSLSPEGLANFIIGSAKLFSGDVELTDPRHRKLAEVCFCSMAMVHRRSACSCRRRRVCRCRDRRHAGRTFRPGLGWHWLGEPDCQPLLCRADHLWRPGHPAPWRGCAGMVCAAIGLGFQE